MLEDQKTNMRTYNASAAFYAKHYQKSFDNLVKEDAERFVSLLSGPKIVEMGCGPGIALEYFREKGLDALGIDLSDGFVQVCSEKGLNVRKMDMENPLLWPNQFDGLWANMSMLHVPKERVPKLINTWARLLKSNGLLYISVKEGTQEGIEVDEDNPPYTRWMAYFMDTEIKSFFLPRFECVWEHRLVLPSGRARLKYLFRLK